MNSKIATGIWLIFFGIVALLHNFDVLIFNFYALLKYWPLLIVSLGINLIFQYKNYGAAFIIILNVVICGFLAYIGYSSKDQFNWKGKVGYTNSMKVDTANISNSAYVPYSEDFEKAKFEFNIGASSVKIDSLTSHILEAKSGSKNLNFNLETNKNNIELNTVIGNKKAKDHAVYLALNTYPVWNFTFNIGAAKFDADFSNHKFSKLELNSGAASVNIKLGQPIDKNVKVEINTAASSSIISIPKDVACAVEITTVLSSNKLPGFTKKNDLWQTDNYETAAKKYLIEVNGAANSLKIDRY